MSGCGSTDTESNEKSASQDEATSDDKGEDTNSSSGEKVHIKVQSWQYALGNYKGFTEDDDIAQAIKEDFEKSHPDIEVEVVLTRQEDHFNALRVDFAAGSAPDVIGITPGSTLEQFKTQFEPLAPYAEEEWGADWMDRYTEASFSSIQMSGEEIYAFPSAMSAAGTIWVAGEQMKAAGADTIPTTWDELVETAAKLRENGSIPMMFGGQDTWQNYDMFITLMGTINKDLCDQIFSLEADWNQEDVIKAFDYYQKLFTEGIVQDGALTTAIYNEGYSQWRDDSGAGTVPMIFNGSWDLSALKNTNDYYDTYSARDIQITKFPSIEGKESVIISAPDVAWSMNAASEQKDAAWEFIKWMCDDMQQQVVDGLGFFSVLKDAPQPTVEMTEDYKKAYDVVSEAIASGNTIGYREAFYADMSEALFDNLQLLATGDSTPEEAAVAMDEACASLK